MKRKAKFSVGQVVRDIDGQIVQLIRVQKNYPCRGGVLCSWKSPREGIEMAAPQDDLRPLTRRERGGEAMNKVCSRLEKELGRKMDLDGRVMVPEQQGRGSVDKSTPSKENLKRAENPVKIVVAGCADLIHQHCVFCGAVIPEMATWDWDTVCKSPLNDLPPDTVGNRHHAYLRWENKQSVLEVRANQLLAGKGPTAQ